MCLKLKDFLLKKRFTLLVVYGLVAVVATLQQYYGGPKRFPTQTNDRDYTYYNNYIIFKQSFFHLKNGSDLYSLHWDEHWDLYKYSPSFALLFGALAWMPDEMGFTIWNLINAFGLFFGIRMLSKIDLEKQNLILLFFLAELFTNLQNSQSNALIAGLVVMAFALMEKQQFFLACLLIALTVYIKLFGVFAFALCLLYPQRWKLVGYSVAAVILLGLLPMIMIGPLHLKSCYASWWHLLQSDYTPGNLSLIGVIKAWSGVSTNQNIVLLIGIVLFAVPFLRVKFYSHYSFRLAILAMSLIWMVIFNHKAESPTFIIAIAGVGLWSVSSGLHQPWRIALVLFAFVFTTLSPTDLFPNFIQDNYFDRFSIKTIPCIIIYTTSIFELIVKPNQLAPL